MDPTPRRVIATRRAQLLLATVVALAALVFVLAGGVGFISDADRVESFFADRQVMGPIVFVLLMWGLQPWGIPGAVFMVPASLVWPLPVAMALSWVGNMGASTIAFAFARFIGRDWVQRRIPPSVARYEARLVSGGVGAVTLLRVVTGQLPPADWMLGVTRVRWPAFLVGTGIGIIPGIVLIVAVGGSAFSALADRPGLLVGLIVLLVVLSRRRRRRVRTDEESSRE